MILNASGSNCILISSHLRNTQVTSVKNFHGYGSTVGESLKLSNPGDSLLRLQVVSNTMLLNIDPNVIEAAFTEAEGEGKDESSVASEETEEKGSSTGMSLLIYGFLCYTE